MDNPETLTTLGTKDEDKQSKNKQKTKTMSNTDPHKKLGCNQALAKGTQILQQLRTKKNHFTLNTITGLDFRTVRTVWYFYLFFHFNGFFIVNNHHYV